MQWIDFVLNNASLLTVQMQIDKLKELKKLLRYSDSRPYSTQLADKYPLLNSRDPSLTLVSKTRNTLRIRSNGIITFLATSYKREMSVSQIATMRSVTIFRPNSTIVTLIAVASRVTLGNFCINCDKLNYFLKMN